MASSACPGPTVARRAEARPEQRGERRWGSPLPSAGWAPHTELGDAGRGEAHGRRTSKVWLATVLA